MDLDFVSVHKNAKKELGQYPAILTSRLVNNAYIDELKDFVDFSKFTKVTPTNQVFSVELSKNDDRQGKRSEIRT